MSVFTFKAIGVIHSPFKTLESMPIQPMGAKDIEGIVDVFPEYEEGLQDLEGFSHIILLYHFHQVRRVNLKVIPFLDQQERGVFATRAPVRPNPIGLSIVELVSREKNVLFVKNVDILDGTPLIDIKPYVEKFDHPTSSRAGWLERNLDKFSTIKTDKRFIDARE